MTKQEKIIDKIAKLLALSTSDNQHEAELAAQRASDLMEKHQIDMSAVLVKDAKSGNIVEINHTVEGQKMKLLWIETLANGCAKLFDGTILVNQGLHGTSFRWVAQKGDIELMQAVFDHLYKSWFSIVKSDLAESKENHSDSIDAELFGKWAPKDTMKFKAGHGRAYANVIFHRCVELAEARKEKVAASGTTGTALVVQKDQALQEYSEKQHWGTKKAKASVGSIAGQLAGQAAGRSASLGGAIEN